MKMIMNFRFYFFILFFHFILFSSLFSFNTIDEVLSFFSYIPPAEEVFIDDENLEEVFRGRDKISKKKSKILKWQKNYKKVCFGPRLTEKSFYRSDHRYFSE